MSLVLVIEGLLVLGVDSVELVVELGQLRVLGVPELIEFELDFLSLLLDFSQVLIFSVSLFEDDFEFIFELFGVLF